MPIGPVIISLKGKTLCDEERNLLKHKNIGGIVLLKQNYDEENENPKQGLKDLITDIRKINKDIIVMVDHEGGKVWRFKKGFTQMKSARDWGRMYDQDKSNALKEIRQVAAIMASELVECGVDMSLAPVLDLHGPSKVIGGFDRAFHANKEAVAEMGEAFILGMQDGGMLGVAKHFPGHGSLVPDTHHEIARDERNYEALLNDLFPFKKLAEKGLIAAVMPAHVIYDCVDPKNPAGFSEIWIKGCLRMGCGFDGVVMSDTLKMAAAANIGNTEQRLKAAEKVCDFLMFTHQHSEDELKALIKALDKLEDNKEAGERRQVLRNKIDEQIQKYKAAKLSSIRSEVSASLQSAQSRSPTHSSNTGKPSTPWFQFKNNSTSLHRHTQKPSSARGSDTQAWLTSEEGKDDKKPKKTRRAKSWKGKGDPD